MRALHLFTKPKLFAEFPVYDQFQPKTSSSSEPPRSPQDLRLRLFQTSCSIAEMRRTLSMSVALTSAAAAVGMVLERWLRLCRANVPPPPPGLRLDSLPNPGDAWLSLGLWELPEMVWFLMNHHVLTLEVVALNKYLLLLTVSICC